MGDTISAAGGALSTVAVPLLALETLHAGGAAVGAVRAAQTLPFLLFAIPIGLLADRVSRRRLLLAADAVRFPLVGMIALLGAALTVNALIALVFAVGVGTVAYEVAYLSVLPDLVDGPAELPPANRAVETAHAGASLLGPAAGGVLIAALSPAGVVACDAVSFAVGAILTAVNRWEHRPANPALEPAPEPAREPPAVPAEGLVSADSAAGRPLARSALSAGWVWLWRDPVVRPMTLYLAANNVAAQAFQTALLLFVAHTLGLPATAVGFAIAAMGGGFLAGAALSPAAARRAGTGRVIIAASLVGALGIATVAAAPPAAGFWPVLLGAALAGAGPGMINLHSISVRQAITPPTLLGRVNAVVKTISYGATTVGALTGGVAATAFGPRAVIAAAACASAAATLFPALSAIRTLGTPR